MNKFDVSIQMERNGQNFYNIAAETIHDTAAKRILHALADEEQRHELMIRNMQRSEPFCLAIEQVESQQDVFQELLDGEAPLFTDSDSLRDIITKALDLEQNSVDFYERLEAKVTRPKEQSVCRKLRREEERHKKVLEIMLEHVSHPECVLAAAEFLFLIGNRQELVD